jgi:hypothetical protein
VNDIEWVRPGDLRLPGSRLSVDLYKLARQYQQFGNSLEGMPPIEVTRCGGSELLINSGVTRATRAYRYGGGDDARVPVVIIEVRPNLNVSRFPRVSEA